MTEKLVFAFDLGKASLGICIRKGHDIKEVNSLLIAHDYADISIIQSRRRAKKLRDFHKSREDYLRKVWIKVGLTPLNSYDKRLKSEFDKNNQVIYTSCLLRIALLQNKPLEEWQIFKALWSAIQRRGYDDNLPWMSSGKREKTKDDEENSKFLNEYKRLLNENIPDEKYHYPCYLDATLMKLWEINSPNTFKFKNSIETQTARGAGRVAPRKLVEKELFELFENAKRQLPALQNINTMEFLYGEGKQAYSSYENPDYKRFMGKEKWDWQGVLSQKIPRFDNRIISKCCLLPKRNVCKANSQENIEANILIKLKNFRYFDINGEKKALTADQIRKLFEDNIDYILEKAKLNKTQFKNLFKDEGIEAAENTFAKERKYDEYTVNTSGRSRFCRPALKIIKELILSGKSPLVFDFTPFIQNLDEEYPEKGVTRTELENMLSRMGDSWDNIHIGDDRDNLFELSRAIPEQEIAKLIGSVNNYVVHHRLQWFYNELKNLSQNYGKPDEVIFEFIRDGKDNSLFGQIKTQEYMKKIDSNEKDNKNIIKKLEEANIDIKQGFERLKLLEMQGGKCIYTGVLIHINDILNCQIDHIVPVSQGGNDSLFNKVLCTNQANQEKRERTPYQWLKGNEERWNNFCVRVLELSQSLGKKKVELLILENAPELIESYRGLAETSYIARLVQKITAIHFGWGLQVKDEDRKIYTSNGSETAKIRSKYGLNSLLYPQGADAKERKNRSNPKHHALDAICISYSREYKAHKDDKGGYKFYIEGFNFENVRNALDGVIPYEVKRNTSKLKIKETIYGKRIRNEKYYLTVKKNIVDIEYKENSIKKIFDEDIRNNLLTYIDKKLTKEEWTDLLLSYVHPVRKIKVKRVQLIETEQTGIVQDMNGRERFGEFADFGNKSTKGQFKHSDSHQGQLIYFDQKNNPKVIPVYTNLSLKDKIKELKEQNLNLYNNGMMFYSGCLLNVPNDFYKGSDLYKAGLYILRTIKSNGSVKIETLEGKPIENISLKSLVNAEFIVVNPKELRKLITVK